MININRQQARDMAAAHAEGQHEVRREGCPECEGRSLQSYPEARRVQIPPYTDRWMMGDRYGLLVDIRHAAPKKGAEKTSIAHVKLDKSGKIVRVILDDCQEV